MLRNASDKRKRIATILAFSTIPLSGFVADIYLPSFPTMVNSLGVPEHDIQLTLTCFFLSMGVSQLFVGPLLDSIGRFKPGTYGLVALGISSILIGISKDIQLICFLRIIQGIATSFVIVGKRAFFVDLYSGDKLKHYLSYFTVIWSTGPIVAPFLGGYLQKYFNWEFNFYFLALYAFLLLIFELIFSGETLAERRPIELVKIKDNYIMMLRNAKFLLGVVTLGMGYSVVMIFNISGPFVIENTFRFNAVTIGYCTLILGFSWMIGGLIGKRLMKLHFTRKASAAVIVQLSLITILFLIGIGYQQLWCLMLFAFLIHICSGFLYNVFFTQGMLYFPQNAGMASGLIGGLAYVTTSISSFVLSRTGKIVTQQDMVLRYLATAAVLSFVVFCTVRAVKRSDKLVLV